MKRTVQDCIISPTHQDRLAKLRSQLLEQAPEYIVDSVLEGLRDGSENLIRGVALEYIRIALELPGDVALDQIIAKVEHLAKQVKQQSLPALSAPTATIPES